MKIWAIGSSTVRQKAGDVLEPLSEPIRKLILELKLCSESDFRRSRRRVRRLTFDLPAFDSVWLDALVQIGRLTPFQARLLESANPATLRIGPCVAVNRIGSGPNSQTLLARARDGRELCVTKILGTTRQISEETVERLQDMVGRLKGFDHPYVVAPLSCVRADNQVVLVSRYVPGPHLAELLVRRGRFPAAIVWEIGRQMVEGLEVLSQWDIVHGDVRAANVRLTSAGTAVLVDAGIRPVLDPAFTIHTGFAPDRCDGVAPELIGGSVAPNVRSEAYALGCLLWQLLAGRPPFPGGDPLVKLAAHQTRTIDDVRKWAPETPPALAEGIRRLTAREASERPAEFSEILAAWQAPGRRGRAKLADFRRRFDLPARLPHRIRRLSTPTRWLFMLATLFALSGGVVTLSDKGARSVVLAWAARFSQTVHSDFSEREEDKSRHPVRMGDDSTTLAGDITDQVGRPLPTPDRHGVIRLDAAGPWRPSDVHVVGGLTIEGDRDLLPEIVIVDRPLRLWAESVKIKNVRVTASSVSLPSPANRNALLLVQSQELVVEGCVFDAGSAAASMDAPVPESSLAPPTGPALVAWKLLDAAEQRGRTATIRNTLLLGDGPALYLAHAVRQLEFDNVLKFGTSPLVQLAAFPMAKSTTVLRITHTTCRSSGALLRCIVPEKSAPVGRVLVEAGDCVFGIVSRRAALFEFAGPTPLPEWLRSVKMTGEGSLATPTLAVAAWVSTEDGRLTQLDPSGLELEGIFAGPFRFAGERGAIPSDAEVLDSEAPRRSSEPPGVRASTLPAFQSSVVSREAPETTVAAEAAKE